MNAQGIRRLRDHELRANLDGCWREVRKIEAAHAGTTSVMADPKYRAMLNMAIAYRHELDRRTA